MAPRKSAAKAPDISPVIPADPSAVENHSPASPAELKLAAETASDLMGADALSASAPVPLCFPGVSVNDGPWQFSLPVSIAQIQARIDTCIGVATHCVRDRDASPVDGVLVACLAELDALRRIFPTQGN